MAAQRQNPLGTIGRTVDNASSAAGRWAGRALGAAVGGIGAFVGGGIGDFVGRNIRKVLQGLAAFVFAVMVANFIATVIVVVILVIFAAFALFVINSGGYLVPPGSSLSSLPPDWPVIDVGASCPIPGGVILTGSYGSPNGSTQHGTNVYWDSLAARYPRGCTSFSIPGFAVGQCLARQPRDYCFEEHGGCEVYGLAADFIYPDGQSAGKPVYLPYIEGASVLWGVTFSAADPQGRGILTTNHDGISYEMYVTHLETAPVGGQSGDVFGNLSGDTFFDPHLHVELRVDGEFVPPDFMCTGGSVQPPDNIGTAGCFEFSGPWPEEALENEIAAAEIIMSNTPYSDRLCAGGIINVTYRTPGECQAGICYGGRFLGDRNLLIFPPGTGSVANSLFTLAHEAGHIFQGLTDADNRMLEDPGVVSELPPFSGNLVEGICTYPLDANSAPGKQISFWENFAESIALYISGRNPESVYRDFSCLGGTFQTRYPNTWRYIRDNVFFNNGPW